jgi:hypothetical protein
LGYKAAEVQKGDLGDYNMVAFGSKYMIRGEKKQEFLMPQKKKTISFNAEP